MSKETGPILHSSAALQERLRKPPCCWVGRDVECEGGSRKRGWKRRKGEEREGAQGLTKLWGTWVGTRWMGWVGQGVRRAQRHAAGLEPDPKPTEFNGKN